MDYVRIYAEFINDRKSNQPQKPDYFEKHHIVPRSLGGGNDKSNIIRLTPEDHYFAHLILARIHGGHLWSCVLLLSGKRRWNTPWADVVGNQRYGYGLAKRKHSEKERLKDGLKGSDNGNHNPIKYEWVNLDTQAKEVKTLIDMWSCYGGSRGQWTSVASGYRKTMLGWSLEGSVVRIRGLKGKPISFVNRDGRAFTGTQSEFCKFAGISVASASRVSRHGDVTTCGWRLNGTQDRSHLATKATGRGARLNSGATYEFEKSGCVVIGKVSELAAHFCSTKQQVHAGINQIKTGRMDGYKGWKYKGIKSEII